MKPLSVLVADDEQDIRVLLELWLKEAGHTVVLVDSAKAALQMVKQQPFDLVVTDVLMPEGDGLELIGAMKTVQPATRILAISGGGRYLESEDCLKMARGWGAHAALLKPFGQEQFTGAIKQTFAPPPGSGGLERSCPSAVGIRTSN